MYINEHSTCFSFLDYFWTVLFLELVIAYFIFITFYEFNITVTLIPSDFYCVFVFNR